MGGSTDSKEIGLDARERGRRLRFFDGRHHVVELVGVVRGVKLTHATQRSLSRISAMDAAGVSTTRRAAWWHFVVVRSNFSCDAWSR